MKRKIIIKIILMLNDLARKLQTYLHDDLCFKGHEILDGVAEIDTKHLSVQPIGVIENKEPIDVFADIPELKGKLI